MTTIELFKGEQIDAQRLTITTAGSSAACGVYMELGQEYLIGLYRDENGQFAANTCFLFRSWSGVTKDELILLENGCADDGCDDDAAALLPNGCDDTCGGLCGEFQVGGGVHKNGIFDELDDLPKVTQRRGWQGARGVGGSTSRIEENWGMLSVHQRNLL